MNGFTAGLITGILSLAAASAAASQYRVPESVAPVLLKHGQTAPAVSENLCSLSWERETDGWWECFVAAETDRCIREGWCSDWPSDADIKVVVL